MSEEIEFTKIATDSKTSHTKEGALGAVKVSVSADNDKTTFYNAQLSDGATTVSV